ncbi:hypothetical protein ACIPSE_13090 [Streptomyces sp. NPDC090106]|uniref:hypothetical protein n=1 Tax=Streptomyces sp. NPDC090106 TaxID=3365946 RepID=UPI0037F699F9
MAFIQLLVAMERDGELVREVRGKRTYRITAAEPPVGQRRIPPELPQSTESTESTESMEPTAPPAGSAGHGEIDYPLLARHVLRELSDSGTLALIQELTAEQRRIAVERDDYARRLALARARLEELRDRSATTSTPGGTPPDAPDRRRRPPGDPLHHG